MNPEIKKFWGNLYIFQDEAVDNAIEYYVVYASPYKYLPVATEYSDGTWVYCIHGQWYNEADALRLVRLKAFL